MKRAGKDFTIIEIVALNVRVARKAAGLSQEELAHEARIDRTYISQVERKQRNLTISVLARIARALGITPEKLLVPAVQPSLEGVRKRRKVSA
jgi:transcriptional regulator with XRE-family HTH domain